VHNFPATIERTFVSDSDYPEDLQYTAEHEWVRINGDIVRVGITAFAQSALGDIVYVTLPESGAAVEAGGVCGEVESTKSVSDVYSPVSGTVTALNPALEGEPELVNSDSYGEGWMFEVRVPDPTALDGLLSAAEYRAQLA
jgi:glycine cleavage system H protein